MPTASAGASRLRKRALRILAPALALYLLLLVPDAEPAAPPAAPTAFAWNQDARWADLERRFAAARREDPARLRDSIRALLERGEAFRARLAQGPLAPENPVLDEIEELLFGLGAAVAAHPDSLEAYVRLAVALRDAVKERSAAWDMNSTAARDRLYRLLYGGRAAVEEALLQAPPGALPAAVACRDEPSGAPSAAVLGLRVRSGDILVSRGGAPTSALIARGSDYAGNFSHVALLHVDEAGAARVVEAHIERGVTVAPIDDYLRDRKLRVMVLRLRSDLPALRADPMLPHHAASAALAEAATRHIPYDFAMDFEDPSRLFCSEVASAAYRKHGVTLWMGLSRISTPGVRAWLAAFGVTHFTTQEPSDLEYDPQLRVVGEWRDPEALFKDHVDNAATDVLLEGAERGERLDYPLLLLPFARLAKAYSAALNLFGGVGPVPQGMSATAALKHGRYGKRHAALVERILERARAFRAEKGYVPPYWELLKLAR